MVLPTAVDIVNDLAASECNPAEAKRRKLWQPTNSEAGDPAAGRAAAGQSSSRVMATSESAATRCNYYLRDITLDPQEDLPPPPVFCSDYGPLPLDQNKRLLSTTTCLACRQNTGTTHASACTCNVNSNPSTHFPGNLPPCTDVGSTDQIVATPGHTAISGLVQPTAVPPSTIARSSCLEVMVQPMGGDTVTDSTDSAASGDSKLFDNFFAEEQEVKPICKQEAIPLHPVQTSVPDTPETFETKRRRLQSACMNPYYIDTGRPPDARVPVIIKNKYTTGSPTW